MDGHLHPVGAELVHNHRGKRVLDAAVEDLAAGGDHAHGLAAVGKYLQKGLVSGSFPRRLELFLPDHQGDDPGAAELVPGLHGGVGVAGGDHQFLDHVHRGQAGCVHPEEAVAGGGKFNFALLDLAARHVFAKAQCAQRLRAVIFMEHARLHLPDVEMLLAHGEEHGDVLLGDHMSLAELWPFEFAADDAGEVVAEHMPHGLLYGNELHFGSSCPGASKTPLLPPSL